MKKNLLFTLLITINFISLSQEVIQTRIKSKLRVKPDPSSQIIKIIQPGKYISVLKKNDNYYRVRYQNHTGYLNTIFICKPGEKPSDFKINTAADIIKQEVAFKFEKWLEKDEFEKTSWYEQRISSKNREAKLQEITKNTLDKYKTNFLSSLNSKIFTLSTYDADNELFKINLNNNNIILPVPINEAKQFKLSKNKTRFNNIDVSLNEEGDWIITKLEAHNSSLNKSYFFDIAENYKHLTQNMVSVEVNDLAIDLPKQKSLSNNSYQTKTKKIIIETPDVNKNIPFSNLKNKSTYCLIVGNEDYSTRQPSLTKENDVPYAIDDATIFSEYAIKTLGIPTQNITILKNATKSEILQGIDKLKKLSSIQNGLVSLIFYYAGHGLPDEIKNEQYLIPIDVSSSNIKHGIKVNRILEDLNSTNPQKITLFLDACFSGGARNLGLLTTRGIKIAPKKNKLQGNIVVFASSSGSESSNSYDEKQHGMFTYFLLKKLKETKGNTTYNELFNYIEFNVKLNSVLHNNKQQTPKINVSSNIFNQWKNWKF